MLLNYDDQSILTLPVYHSTFPYRTERWIPKVGWLEMKHSEFYQGRPTWILEACLFVWAQPSIHHYTTCHFHQPLLLSLWTLVKSGGDWKASWLRRGVKEYYGHLSKLGTVETRTTGAIVCTIEKANTLVNQLLEDGTFSELVSTVVVDELHVYNGLFGAHVALIMRRLRRICAAIGNRKVRFISCSAAVADQHQTQRTFGTDRVWFAVLRRMCDWTVCAYLLPSNFQVHALTTRRKSDTPAATSVGWCLNGARLIGRLNVAARWMWCRPRTETKSVVSTESAM